MEFVIYQIFHTCIYFYLSGSKCSGSGQYSGSWCKPYTGIATEYPLGNVYPLMVTVSSISRESLLRQEYICSKL